jgi:hypothetical protein
MLCSVKIHIFAKIRILCNATAGREREPRRIVIPGRREVHPLEVADLHQQAEVSAEAQERTSVHAVHPTKAEMAKAVHVVHLELPSAARAALHVVMETAKAVKALRAVLMA